ncbi:MAG: hypothetical protein LBK60_01000 [Verrucomicrobiales bacterium]|jgi:hypothetical protein|nr:hypothetical protein [Verrucomicrobiales bacterium]
MSTHSTGNIPSTDGDFIPYAQNIYDVSFSNRVAWGVSQAYLDELKPALAQAATAFDLKSKDATRTHATVALSKAACHSLRVLLSAFIHHLKALKNTVTEGDLAAMGISPRHPGTRHPLPTPTEAPELTLTPGGHYDLDIYLTGLQKGGNDQYLVPGHVYHSAIVQYRFEDAPADGPWEQKIVTKKHLTLIFEETARGKYLLVKAVWLNPTMQPGPWSDTRRIFIS